MRHDDAYLLGMLLAAREAEKFTADLTFGEFKRNRMAQIAILKAVEFVGEAKSQVSAEGKKAHSQIPWTKVIGMRNRLVHGYFNVNLERVWETVQQDLPHLISLLEPLVLPDET